MDFGKAGFGVSISADAGGFEVGGSASASAGELSYYSDNKSQ